MHTVAIVNPAAGGGRSIRKLAGLAAVLGEGRPPTPVWWTAGPRHAEHLAAKARREGVERVVVVGGDGTLFEVINGLWREPEGALPSVGIVPVGTGCDYGRNFRLGATLREKLATALAGPCASVDVGACRLTGMDGRVYPRVFLNVLGFGFDAAVIQRLNSQRLKWRGRLPYLLATLREMLRAGCCTVSGTIDAEAVATEALLFAAGIGKSFGGGMRIAPDGRVDGGRFQLVWGERLGRLELLRLFPKIYSGRHLDHPKVRSRLARSAALSAAPAAWVEAEGELIGTTPVELEIHPRALRIACDGIKT